MPWPLLNWVHPRKSLCCSCGKWVSPVRIVFGTDAVPQTTSEEQLGRLIKLCREQIRAKRLLAVSYLDGAPRFKTTAPPDLPPRPSRQWAGEDGRQPVTYLREREQQRAIKAQWQQEDAAVGDIEVDPPTWDEVEAAAEAFGLSPDEVV